jgi:hypothetical protein
MSNIISRAKKFFLLVAALVILITALSTQNVFAESATRANSATSALKPNFSSRITGDSYTSDLGGYSKITLYLATTNDPNELYVDKDNYLGDMAKVTAARKDGSPMFIQFGKSVIIHTGKLALPSNMYANRTTSKYDTLVDFKKGKTTAPAYTSTDKVTTANISTTDGLPGLPDWLKSDDSTNQTNVSGWFMNAVNKFQNLRYTVLEVAAKSDSSGASGLTAVGNVLSTTLKKTTFKYTDENGQALTLDKRNVMPGEDKAVWLVIYEPVIAYVQDPNKMFFPSKTQNSFLFTASDAVLANAKAGTSGYPVYAKFAAGTPKLTLEYNHDRDCGYTWYGYPDWNPSIPLARFCPLPCPSVGQHYDGVKTTTRSPFAIPTPIKMAATCFTVDKNWLKYSSGYLFDKPTSDIKNLINSAADVDNILHYGGYSVFVNGPKRSAGSTLNVRVAMLNDDGSFYDIPDAAITFSIKGDPKAPKTVVRSQDYFVSVDDSSDLLGKALDISVSKPINPKPIKSYQLFITTAEYFGQRLTNSDLQNFKAQIEESTGKTININDIELTDDKIMAIYENTDVIKESTDELDWSKAIVFASEKDNVHSMDDISKNIKDLYPVGTKWPDKSLYVTVLIQAKVIPDPTPVPPSSGGMAENELIKAFSGKTISTVSLEKTVHDTTCDGTKTESYTYTETDPKTGKKVTKTGYRTVSCGHPQTLANAKNITPKSLTVQPSWYWANAMFSGLSKLSVLRGNTLTNDGVSFVFNQTGTFTGTDMSNVFNTLTDYKFLVHRSADPTNNGAVKPLQLAGYMNNTNLNKDYLAFITPYYGTYPSAYSNPTGDFGGRTFNLTTSLALPSSVNAIGSGNFCSGGSSDSLSIPSKLTSSDGTFKTQTSITIDPTIAPDSKKSPDNLSFSDSLYWGIGSEDVNPSFHIRFPSDTFTFNPAFKMQYQTSNNGGDYKDVWVLAKGSREFTSTDYVRFEVSESKIEVQNPWSRDREDLYIDPKEDKPTKRTTPTAKSGSAIQASGTGTVLKIDVIYHVLDPNFVDPAQRSALQAKNDGIAENYDNMVKSIISKFENGGVSFYSNLLQAATADTLHKIPSGNNVKDLSSKTTLKLAAPVKVNTGIVTEVAYLDNDSTPDYDPAGKRTISIKGKSYQLNHQWADTSAIKSQEVLKSLLVTNGGNKVSGWYNESFEGIVLVHRVYFLTLTAESTYAQIHPQLSDWQTERNAFAKALPFVYDNTKNLIEGHYGIGLEMRFPSLTIGGQNYTPVLCSKPFLFDLRGSIYDVAH